MDEVIGDVQMFAGSNSGISKPSSSSVKDKMQVNLIPAIANSSASFIGEHGCSGTTGGTIIPIQ